jgi:hypothetical protein
MRPRLTTGHQSIARRTGLFYLMGRNTVKHRAKPSPSLPLFELFHLKPVHIAQKRQLCPGPLYYSQV